MVKVDKIRGSGVRFTLPYFLRLSGLWLLVTSLAMALFGVTCYLFAVQSAESLTEEGRRHLVLVLTVQTIGLLLAAIALAVFTTHRIAGPYIALKRAFEELRDGTFDRPLRLRTADIHLKELEASFNEMAATLQQRLKPGGVSAGAPVRTDLDR
jgi:HAMP domain-containing protein